VSDPTTLPPPPHPLPHPPCPCFPPQEARCIARCRRAGVDAPLLYFLDIPRSSIVMERVHGVTVKQWLWHAHPPSSEWRLVARTTGAAVARLHTIGMVHGDLTTSNIMLRGYPHIAEPVADADGAAAVAAPRRREEGDGEEDGDEVDGDGDGDGGEGEDGTDDAGTAAAAGKDADADGDAAMGGASAGTASAPAADVAAAAMAAARAWLPLSVPARPPVGAGTGVAGDSAAAAAASSSSSSLSSSSSSSSSTSAAASPGVASCRLCLIDFGLAGMGATPEDRGVDLYVLERALLSTHTDIARDFFAELLGAYYAAIPSPKDAAAVKGRFEQVRMRGRKRLAFG
jgi:tRNA A-37 threonylcarbamoyl transferase component Bud32